jgi:amino acid transporter
VGAIVSVALVAGVESLLCSVAIDRIRPVDVPRSDLDRELIGQGAANFFTGLLGGSRVPYDAARDRVFFRPYARLHPRHRFPTLGLATMGVITAIGFLIGRHTDLATLIQLLTTVMVIVQALAQIVALSVLRRRRPTMRRPYRMWLYPVPSIIAFAGWCVIYGYADKNSPGRHPIEWSLAWLALGCVAYVLWARFEKVWPFGPKEITEDYPTPETAPAEPTGA